MACDVLSVLAPRRSGWSFPLQGANALDRKESQRTRPRFLIRPPGSLSAFSKAGPTGGKPRACRENLAVHFGRLFRPFIAHGCPARVRVTRTRAIKRNGPGGSRVLFPFATGFGLRPKPPSPPPWRCAPRAEHWRQFGSNRKGRSCNRRPVSVWHSLRGACSPVRGRAQT